MTSKLSKLDHYRVKNTPAFLPFPVLSNQELAPNIFLLELSMGDYKLKYSPGQFAMLRLFEQTGVFLPRPYSIYWADQDKISFLYKVYGKGSDGISRLRPDDKVLVLGPLGNSFATSSADEIILIAGGIGIAPFPYLINQYLRDKKVILFFGSQKKSQVILKDLFDSMSVQIEFATDDGSLGRKGFVTELFEEYLGKNHKSVAREVYVCGPKQMEVIAAKICANYHIQAQFAMEEHMACGMGVCMGCVIPCDASEEKIYKRVCLEGPVFYGHEICWEEI